MNLSPFHYQGGIILTKKKVCDVKNKEVETKTDCKDCPDYKEKKIFIKMCEHKKNVVTCPHCGEEVND